MIAGLVLLAVLFLCWGSFLNVVAYRLVRGQGVIVPASRCPACGSFIAWYDNIPVVSWIVLAGRCRSCGAQISVLYPFIEVFTAAVMVALVTVARPVFIPAYFIFFSALIVTLRSDIETMLISRFVTLFLVPVGFVLSIHGLLPIRSLESILGAIVGYGVLWIISTVFSLVTGKRGMGEGDFEVLAFIGSFVGVQGAWLILMASSIAGSIFGACMVATGRATRATKIPFGPFLALAAIVFVLMYAAR